AYRDHDGPGETAEHHHARLDPGKGGGCLEDQDRPTAVIATSVQPASPRDVVHPAPSPPRPEVGGWIVSPAYDLFFIANLAWPLPLLPGPSGHSETVVDFWQVYFLTLPHRWITLILVVLDPDRRGPSGLFLAAIAAVILLVVVGVRLGTSGFTCLAMVDYI